MLIRFTPAAFQTRARAAVMLDGFASMVTSAPAATENVARTVATRSASSSGSTSEGVPPPMNTVSRDETAETFAEVADLGDQRVHVRHRAGCTGDAREVAVLAFPLAERDVQVERANVVECGAHAVVSLACWLRACASSILSTIDFGPCVAFSRFGGRGVRGGGGLRRMRL